MPATVLVIEDDEAVRTFFSRALELSGFVSVEAATAEHALRLLAEGRSPDAVLLDLAMPGIGGLGFLAEMLGDARYRRIPVAIVTGHIFIEEEIRAAADDLGIAIYHKPLTLEELLRITGDLVRR